MESITEDYGPAGCMEEAEDGEPLTAHEAKKVLPLIEKGLN